MAQNECNYDNYVQYDFPYRVQGRTVQIDTFD